MASLVSENLHIDIDDTEVGSVAQSANLKDVLRGQLAVGELEQDLFLVGANDRFL